MIRTTLMLAVLLSGCGLFGSSKEDRDLSDARHRWEALGWDDYNVLMLRGCFCAGAGTYDVWVRDEDVIAVWSTEEWPNHFPPTWWEYVPSIDGLFDLIDRANDEADLVEVEYSEKGWPTRVEIDWYRNAVDDEITYRVDQVTEVASASVVELAPGDTYTEAGTTVRFDAVTDDSRCALSVECIWAGEATASFTATPPGGPEETFELADPPGSPAAERTREVGTLRVTLILVQPYPLEPGTIDADDYRVRVLFESL